MARGRCEEPLNVISKIRSQKNSSRGRSKPAISWRSRLLARSSPSTRSNRKAVRRRARANSGARMRFGVRFLQALDGDVRVNLRRRQARVSKQRLDAAQVRAAIEQVSGEAVPEFVRTHRDRNRGVPQIAFQN